jgi:pimeloyl-ACP methyl ester carboxylesterase
MEHGMGGWCYRDTAHELRSRGHIVVTPTLTGDGERFHASSQAITLETHIRDVVGCIEAEELDQVVLCGHSYGGMVITGMADRMAERIQTLVYLDAFVPEHGDSCHGLLPKALRPEVARQFLETHSRRGAGKAFWHGDAVPRRNIQRNSRKAGLGKPALCAAGACYL